MPKYKVCISFADKESLIKIIKYISDSLSDKFKMPSYTLSLKFKMDHDSLIPLLSFIDDNDIHIRKLSVVDNK